MTLEDVTLAVGQGEPVYVFAPTYVEFQNWRRRNLPLLDPMRLRYVMHLSSLRGLYKPKYIVVRNFPRGDFGRAARAEMEFLQAVCLGHFDY